MVVEDESDIRDILCLMLESYGYPTVGASDGVCALRLLQEGPLPRLFFVDLMMPHMNGEDLIRNLHLQPAYADIPIVIISGHDSVAKVAASLSVNGFLIKPLESDQLLRYATTYAQAHE